MDELYSSNVYRYSIEPTSSKGLHRYVDLVSLLPSHIQNRPDLMKIILLFQDFLNDGYRKIPEPFTTITYKNPLIRGNDPQTISYIDIKRPLNHTTSMYKRRLAEALNYSNIEDESIEEYDKERDLYTWAIEDEVLDQYLKDNQLLIFGDSMDMYSYYNEPKIYLNPLTFYVKLNKIIANNPSETSIFQNVFMYFSTKNNKNLQNLDEASMSFNEMKSIFPLAGNLPIVNFNYYACDSASFLEDFNGFIGNTELLFKVESRKFPYFYGISEYLNNNEIPPFYDTSYKTFDDLISDPKFNDNYLKSFRVSITFNSRKTADSLITDFFDIIPDECIGTFSFEIKPESISDVILFASSDHQIIASSLQVIKKYEHPEQFHKTFGYQNEYRHPDKGASIAEKIHRLAYSKDPSVFDYEYLRLISQHFGYSLETDEDEINQNSYYKTKEEKEQVLRNLIKNTPEFNRMKGTDSGIEMVLLSFGLIGRIVTLYTRGNSKVPGYVDFIDGRAINGVIQDYLEYKGLNVVEGVIYDSSGTEIGPYNEDEITEQMSETFRINSVSNDSNIYDWYASPHFRVEFDLLKDYLNISRNSQHFSTIAKTIKRIKPINTVFQGFYAKLSAEYGKLFINPPLGISKAKIIANLDTNNSAIDEWQSQCALELQQ